MMWIALACLAVFGTVATGAVVYFAVLRQKEYQRLLAEKAQLAEELGNALEKEPGNLALHMRLRALLLECNRMLEKYGD